MFKSIVLSGGAPPPPPGVKVAMPTIKPRSAVPGTDVDANGVNLTGRPQMRLRMTGDQTQEYWTATTRACTTTACRSTRAVASHRSRKTVTRLPRRRARA